MANLLFLFLIFVYTGYSEAAYFGDAEGVNEALLLGGIALVVGLSYSVSAVAGGVGLIMGREWGRKLCIAHAIMSLILFPIGTVVGILSLRYLVRKDEYVS